jgi:LPS-assembly protein
MHSPGSTSRTRSLRSSRLQLWIACILCSSGAAIRADECEEPTPLAESPTPTAFSAEEPIEFQSESLEASRDGEMLLKGEVVISQGVRKVKTRDAVYDQTTQSFEVENGVEYSDPNLKVTGTGAHVDPAGGAEFEGASFELSAIGARGSAGRIRATPEGELALDDVRYTTCPVGNEDWMLRAADIDISQRAGLGVGRGVRLDFKGVPLMYTPFITFPVGNERKSGFLFPAVGSSSSSGYSLSTPWYWDIAPNYDATFVPTWYSKRGAKLDTEFRYLSRFGRGEFNGEYLPEDRELGRERSFVQWTDETDFTRRMRLDIDAANVSDSQWFEDFGLGPEGTSNLYLNRQAHLTFLDNHWLATLRAQNFQTIDDRIAPTDRPHTLLPQLGVRGYFPDQPFGLAFGIDAEVANFDHNVEGLPTGWRLDAAPEVRMPLRGSGVFLEPSASWRYTTYRLDDDALADDSPSRSAPILSVDGGLIFERPAGSRRQRLQTLEPRFMYLYVPYRDQSALPRFDTTLADLNLVQLFRTNRYVGADLLSDANQLSFGLTSRLLDADTGRQYIAATIGQAYYFDEPLVALADEVRDDPETSDIVAELDVTAFADWNISAGVQWDPGETRSEKGDVMLQYKPEPDRVVNVGYRFRRGNIEQVDASAAWPVSERWSAYGRLVFSLEDETTLDQFAGVEYRSCCWRLRLVGRRYVSDRTGDRDTSILLQLELNGLSSVGVGADAFLERSIRGYSLEPSDPAETP